MTHTVDNSATWSRPDERVGDDLQAQSGAQRLHPVVEQATGALIFRYSIGSEAAASLMELWAAEAGVSPTAVARAIVLDICQGRPGTGSDPRLVRWLEDRLRQEVSLQTPAASPTAEENGQTGETGPEQPVEDEPAPEAVVVAVDHSDVSLDAVVEATRRAARLGVALRVTLDPSSARLAADLGEEHLGRRVDLAVELARALEPGLVVLRPEDTPAG